jgi:hypothetical protein
LKSDNLASALVVFVFLISIVQDAQPLLAVRLELLNNEIVTTPPMDRSTITTSLQETVERWLDSILNRGMHIETLSTKVNDCCQMD